MSCSMVCIPLSVAAGYKALSYQSLLTVVAAHQSFWWRLQTAQLLGCFRIIWNDPRMVLLWGGPLLGTSYLDKSWNWFTKVGTDICGVFEYIIIFSSVFLCMYVTKVFDHPVWEILLIWSCHWLSDFLASASSMLSSLFLLSSVSILP